MKKNLAICNNNNTYESPYIYTRHIDHPDNFNVISNNLIIVITGRPVIDFNHLFRILSEELHHNQSYLGTLTIKFNFNTLTSQKSFRLSSADRVIHFKKDVHKLSDLIRENISYHKNLDVNKLLVRLCLKPTWDLPNANIKFPTYNYDVDILKETIIKNNDRVDRLNTNTAKAEGHKLYKKNTGGFIRSVKVRTIESYKNFKLNNLTIFNLNNNVRLVRGSLKMTVPCVLFLLFCINNIPSANIFADIVLKSELLGATHIHNNSVDLLNMFKTKLKNKDDQHKPFKNNDDYYYIGKPRHYPPANKEWFNSIYAYNDKTIKSLPTQNKVTHKLIKSYFNFYSRKLEKKTRKNSPRLRLRFRRLSTNRILISKQEFKHTNDNVVVTIYVYNREKKYYFNKLISIAMLDNLLPNKKKNIIIKRKSLRIRSKVKNQKKLALKTATPVTSSSSSKDEEDEKDEDDEEDEDEEDESHKDKLVSFSNLLKKNWENEKSQKKYETSYLKRYVTRCLRQEMLEIYFLQIMSFNESKFEKKYLLPIANLVKRVYNKKIEFNIVNLKHLYFNSYMLSETLVTKLRNRKNRLLRVLQTSLQMFKLPPIDRVALYEEIYNRKKKLQNFKVDNSTAHFISLKSNIKSQFNDLLEGSLLNTDLKDSIYKLKNFKSHESSLTHSHPLFIVNAVFKSIKNISVSGIRLEIAGRLTRRNRADRSLFKVKYKGSIKNMHSSYKGLSAVLLRGYAKSNLQFSKFKSRIRIGSYGLKAWVSSSS